MGNLITRMQLIEGALAFSFAALLVAIILMLKLYRIHNSLVKSIAMDSKERSEQLQSESQNK